MDSHGVRSRGGARRPGPDRDRGGARRPRGSLGHEPARVLLPHVRRRSRRGGDGAVQHPLPHRRHRVHRRPVRRLDVHLRRPGRSDRLPVDGGPDTAKPAEGEADRDHRRADPRRNDHLGRPARSRSDGDGRNVRGSSRGGRTGRRRADHLHLRYDEPAQGGPPHTRVVSEPSGAGGAARPHLQRRAYELPAALPRVRDEPTSCSVRPCPAGV